MTSPPANLQATVYPEIRRATLAALVDMAGPPTTVLSPRELLGEAADLDVDERALLYGNGAIDLPDREPLTLTEQFARIADVIRGPRSTINLRIWSPPGAVAETSILLPGPLHLGGGITLNQVNTSYRITFPVEAEHILDLMAPALPSGGGDPGVSLDTHLTHQTAAVLAAVLDLGRVQLAAGDGDHSFSAGELAALLEQQWVEVGLDQIRTHVATATLSAVPVPSGVVESELAELSRIGIVRADQDRFALSRPLQAVARLTIRLGGGLHWQRVTELPGGDLHWSDRLLIYGDGGLILSLGPTVDGYVAVQTLTRQQTLAFVAGELRAADVTSS